MVQNAIVVCERSGVLREALIEQGVNAWSCDLADTEIPGNHIKADFYSLDYSRYDLIICFPPCRYLTNAGAGKWWDQHRQEQKQAIEDVKYLGKYPLTYSRRLE
jgi:hypothetical protein